MTTTPTTPSETIWQGKGIRIVLAPLLRGGDDGYWDLSWFVEIADHDARGVDIWTIAERGWFRLYGTDKAHWRHRLVSTFVKPATVETINAWTNEKNKELGTVIRAPKFTGADLSGKSVKP